MDSEKIEEEQPLLEKENGTTATVDNKPLSTLSRLCYGIGGIPTMMPTVAMNAYLSLFLLEVAMIHPTYASVVIFTGRAWEAVGNPVIGVIINKLDSRFGKMKPWIVCTLPVLMLSYFLTWVVPDVNEDIKFVYYLFIQCTYLTCLATFNLPYMSLIMYLSNDQQERDSATVYRMVCSLCGTVIGSVIMSLFLATVEQGDSFVDPCVNITQTVTPTLAPEYLDPMKIAFMAAAGTFISVILVCGLVLIFGTKEKKDSVITKRGGEDNIWKSTKSVFSHRSYIIALPCFLTAYLNILMMFSNVTLYLLYALHIEVFYYGIIILQVSDVICMPVWKKLSSKIGKKETMATGLMLSIPVMGSLFFLPENNVVVAFIFCFLLGTVLSSTHLLPWSMLTDVIDDYIVKTEMRKDAIFYSFYASFMKLSIGIGLGMSTLVLGFAGYETGACLQPDSVAMTMRILVSVVPICLILISLIFLYLYPINESRIKENKAVLAKRREQRTSSNGTFDLTSENSDGIRAPRARVTQTLEG